MIWCWIASIIFIMGLEFYNLGFKRGEKRISLYFIRLIKYDPIRLSDAIGTAFPCNLTEKEISDAEKFYDRLTLYKSITEDKKNDDIRKFLMHEIYKN